MMNRALGVEERRAPATMLGGGSAAPSRSGVHTLKPPASRGAVNRRLSWLRALALSIGTALALGCGGPGTRLTTDGAAEPPPPEAPVNVEVPRPSFADEIIYFVMLDRFDNGDPRNDYGGYGEALGLERDADEHVLRHGLKRDHAKYFHGGDLSGLRRRLGYIKRLGATALWLSPVMKNKPVHATGDSVAASNACYHGYCPLDFEQVDPHLGTDGEFRELVQAAHDLGLRVYLDVVANHTADVIHYADCPDRQSCPYVPLSSAPYRDAEGQPFSLEAFEAGAPLRPFPKLSLSSFPRRPVVDEAERFIKRPLFLNDPIYYHNRGVSTFEGESARLGDFYILDDLFSSHPRVIEGMSDVYARWVKAYGIDGMRLDAARHVDPVFWRAFVPAMRRASEERVTNGQAGARDRDGVPPFFVFGEVFDNQPAHLSDAMHISHFDAVLDFGFHGAALAMITGDAGTDVMAQLFAQDDHYNHAAGDARQLPTFVSNHDVGRIGAVLRRNYPQATEETLLARAALGHALMFLSRGVPVIYYGDEQGFTGGVRHGGGLDIGDAASRQDMFESLVDAYGDPALNRTLGRDTTPAANNFDETHPLYRQMQSLARLRSLHPTLARGVQIPRFSTAEPGLLAFSRVDEVGAYLVVLNTKASATRETFATGYRASQLVPLVNEAEGVTSALETDDEGRAEIALGPLSYEVFAVRATEPPDEAHGALHVIAPAHDYASGQFLFEVGLAHDAETPSIQPFVNAPLVRFRATWGGETHELGVDHVAPYRVRFDASSVPSGTSVELAAEATWPSGVTREVSRRYVVETRPLDLRVYYENGNGRTSAFALTDSGRFAGSVAVPEGMDAVTFTVAPGERALSIFFETRGAPNAGLDLPIHLDVLEDLYPRATEDASGDHLHAELYVRNDGSLSDQPMSPSLRPPTSLNTVDAPVDVPLFVRGSMDGWGTQHLLVREAGHRYETTLKLEGSVAFKFADASWSRFNAGAPLKETGLTVGGSSSNLHFDAGAGDTYRVSLMFFRAPPPHTQDTLVLYRLEPLGAAAPQRGVRSRRR